MKTPRLAIASAAIALLAIPAMAVSAPGDLSFISGTAG